MGSQAMRPRRGLSYKDVRAATRSQALSSEHDQSRHYHQKRDWCVAQAMSGCGVSRCNTRPERQRKEQPPIGSG